MSAWASGLSTRANSHCRGELFDPYRIPIVGTGLADVPRVARGKAISRSIKGPDLPAPLKIGRKGKLAASRGIGRVASLRAATEIRQSAEYGRNLVRRSLENVVGAIVFPVRHISNPRRVG